mmetsp:Transcript_12056/g.28590  ORF Transcript_12056/g.28590 Transcript_12056/m.28590 type:complete len:274 (+) Transcript_12056:639-1460(+)
MSKTTCPGEPSASQGPPESDASVPGLFGSSDGPGGAVCRELPSAWLPSSHPHGEGRAQLLPAGSELARGIGSSLELAHLVEQGVTSSSDSAALTGRSPPDPEGSLPALPSPRHSRLETSEAWSGAKRSLSHMWRSFPAGEPQLPLPAAGEVCSIPRIGISTGCRERTALPDLSSCPRNCPMFFRGNGASRLRRRQTCCQRPLRSCCLTGFDRQSHAPAPRHSNTRSCESSDSHITTTGRLQICGVFPIRWRISTPVAPGTCTSDKSRSKDFGS